MFLFWVNDRAIFPVTQGWHLHTMPALIIVKHNFDYFTPLKIHSMAVFQPWIQTPSAPVPDLFSPSSRVRHMLLSELECWAPWAPVSALGATHREWHLTASSPFIPTAPDRKFLWSRYCARAYPPLFWILGIELSIFIFCIWNNILFVKTFWETNALKSLFSKFFTNIWKY